MSLRVQWKTAAVVYVFNAPCESGIGYHERPSFSLFDIYAFIFIKILVWYQSTFIFFL